MLEDIEKIKESNNQTNLSKQQKKERKWRQYSFAVKSQERISFFPVKYIILIHS